MCADPMSERRVWAHDIRRATIVDKEKSKTGHIYVQAQLSSLTHIPVQMDLLFITYSTGLSFKRPTSTNYYSLDIAGTIFCSHLIRT